TARHVVDCAVVGPVIVLRDAVVLVHGDGTPSCHVARADGNAAEARSNGVHLGCRAVRGAGRRRPRDTETRARRGLRKWPGAGVKPRQRDFQAGALPTEVTGPRPDGAVSRAARDGQPDSARIDLPGAAARYSARRRSTVDTVRDPQASCGFCDGTGLWADPERGPAAYDPCPHCDGSGCAPSAAANVAGEDT